MPVTAPEGTVDPLSSRHGRSGEKSGKENRAWVFKPFPESHTAWLALLAGVYRTGLSLKSWKPQKQTVLKSVSSEAIIVLTGMLSLGSHLLLCLLTIRVVWTELAKRTHSPVTGQDSHLTGRGAQCERNCGKCWKSLGGNVGILLKPTFSFYSSVQRYEETKHLGKLVRVWGWCPLCHNLSTRKVCTRGSGVQGQPQTLFKVHSKPRLYEIWRKWKHALSLCLSFHPSLLPSFPPFFLPPRLLSCEDAVRRAPERAGRMACQTLVLLTPWSGTLKMTFSVPRATRNTFLSSMVSRWRCSVSASEEIC